MLVPVLLIPLVFQKYLLLFLHIIWFFLFWFSMCFLDSGKTPLPPYSKSVETLGQKYFCKMIQEVQMPRLTFRWIKNNLRMGTELWGVRCLWGAEVLSLQSCPIRLCVWVCIQIHTHMHKYFFWASIDISGSREWEEFLKTIILVCKIVTLDWRNLIVL